MSAEQGLFASGRGSEAHLLLPGPHARRHWNRSATAAAATSCSTSALPRASRRSPRTCCLRALGEWLLQGGGEEVIAFTGLRGSR